MTKDIVETGNFTVVRFVGLNKIVHYEISKLSSPRDGWEQIRISEREFLKMCIEGLRAYVGED